MVFIILLILKKKKKKMNKKILNKKKKKNIIFLKKIEFIKKMNKNLPKLKRPKRPANPYLLFLKENKDVIMKEKPEFHIKEIVKEIANRWKLLPMKEKKDYFDRYNPEKEKYRLAIKTLKEKQLLVQEQTKLNLKTEDFNLLEAKKKRGRPKKIIKKNEENQPNLAIFNGLLTNENRFKKVEIKGTITFNINVNF